MYRTIQYFGILLLLICFTHTPLHAQKREKWMTNKKMETLFKKYMDKVEGEQGSWQLMFNGHTLFVLSDEANNRMRIFTFIVKQKDLRKGEMQRMLQANFHSALDAKYCFYEGFVISVYTHPLKELTTDQLLSAAGQVINLVETFGQTYSSSGLIYGQPSEPEEEKPISQYPAKRT